MQQGLEQVDHLSGKDAKYQRMHVPTTKANFPQTQCSGALIADSS